jgi:hypothetical protein
MNARSISARTLAYAVAVSATALAVAVSPAGAALITDTDIVPVAVRHEIHAGNGHMDWILFNFGNGYGVNNNEIKERGVVVFNADDANTLMPVGTGNSTGNGPGNGKDTWVSQSYITSIGDLRNFYKLAFPDGEGGSEIDAIVLFVDLCETGQGQGNNPNDFITLTTLNVIVDYDAFPGDDARNDPFANDLDTATQNSTGSGFTGGTTAASLDPSMAPKDLSVVAPGSGWADYMINTGINPFDPRFTDDTRILFFWESINHEGGGTDIFISGVHAPEPGAMVLLTMGGAGILLRRRRR